MGRMLIDAYWLKRRATGDPGESEQTVHLAIQHAGLTDRYPARQGDYLSSFSGGQQKRISLALELMSVPDILLLDEPNSGLDPAGDLKLMESLDAIAKSSSTKIVLVVTHTLTHLPVDAHVVLLGRRGRYLSQVAWSGPRAGMYAGMGVAVGDDAAVMRKLEIGEW
jgi:ABC-type multidrug transport system ATPase subunit